MSRRIHVATKSEIPEGEGRSFEVEDRVIAIFHVDRAFYAIDDLCPHMGASLSAGYLDGCAVICPLHAWRFDVRDGSWLDNPRVKTDSFPVIIDGEDLYVDLEE